MTWPVAVLLATLGTLGVIVGTVIGTMIAMEVKRLSYPERRAEELVCHALAHDVRSGTADRFDYMATRCPARLLIGQKED